MSTSCFAGHSPIRGHENGDLTCPNSACNSDALRTLSQFNDLTSSDKDLIQNLLLSDVVLDRFLIGPSFWERHRTFLISHFVLSRNILKDAYLALALACQKQLVNAPLRSDDMELYKYASSALKHLRQYTFRSKQDVSECLALGAIIVSFTYYSSAAPNAIPICNGTLGLIKETYESSNDLTSDDPVFISCLVLPELPNCLMRGSVPTLKFHPLPLSGDQVDRYTGLFSPLLPHLYDICKLNNALSQANSEDLVEILKAVDRIDQVITAWMPQIPQDFTSRFSATEISQMLCQAQVMRLGALLIIYRLRHPFGTDNGPALAIAKAILTQLDLTQAVTNKNIPYITLPLLAACFEIQDESERQMWLSRLPRVVGVSSGFADYLQRLVTTIWEALDEMRILSGYNMDRVLSLYQ